MSRKISAEAVSLIKGFEGLELEAYADPGTGGDPWTIGYGHTGKDVFPGDRVTEEEAEDLLRDDLAFFEAGIDELIPGLLSHQFGAVVSWAYNVGLGAVKDSTLRRRINNGEDRQRVLAEELPRWNKGGNGVMPGLVKRRDAEVAFAALDAGSPTSAPKGNGATPRPSGGTQAPVKADVILLEDFFTYYLGNPWQKSGVLRLQQALAEQAPGLLLDTAEWVKEYRNSPKSDPEQPDGEVVLKVPYLYQLDSETEQGARMCFSSTNAMLLEYLFPGTLKGVQADDTYLHKVMDFGDTTSAEAQVAALNSYGLEASFQTDGSSARAKELIRDAIPVPIGVLHHGPDTSPTGGGHWLLLVGFDEAAQQWICHDPYGEMNVRDGGYDRTGPTDGRFVRYSYEGLNRRWMVEGEGDGWMLEANP